MVNRVRIITIIALVLMTVTVRYSSAQSLIAGDEWGQEQLLRGLLVPRVETVLSSQMAGKIEKINVTEGDRFKKDDLLVRFDCSIEETKLEKAKTELEAARKTLSVNRGLAHLKSISGLDVAMAEAKVLNAQAEVVVNEAMVEKCNIHAPFTGRVSDLMVNAYQTVSHAEKLMEILDDVDLEIEVIVPSIWLSWLKPGENFSILIDENNKRYPAEVVKLGARIDPVSQSVKIIGRIKQPDNALMAGMSGKISFENQNH